MPPTTIDADRIGPQVNLDEITLPTDVGERMARLFGTDDPVRTAGEWMARTDDAIVTKQGRTPTAADLCTTDDGDHAFESASGDFYQEYVCVLDPIAYPFITDTPGTITTTTAVRGETITIEVDAAGVTADYEDALISVGVSDHVDHIDQVTTETIYRQVCGYIQTFADEAEYEEWADAVDAATTPLSLRIGIGAAGAIADTLFEA